VVRCVFVLCRYKERVRQKHIKSLEPNSTMKFTDSKKWMFLKSGLDDFRNGVPPPATDDIFVKVSLLLLCCMHNVLYRFLSFHRRRSHLATGVAVLKVIRQHMEMAWHFLAHVSQMSAKLYYSTSEPNIFSLICKLKPST